MFKKLVYSTLASLFSFSALATESYTIDSRHTFPSFEINHLGFSIQRGRFNESSGKVVLDTASGTGSIDITVNTTSISTGLEELEEHLRGEDFFDVAKYPIMHFKSDKLQFTKNKLVGADGVLTLHGVSKPVHLKVDYFYCGMNVIKVKYTCGANAVTTIKRSDFGINKYVPMISDKVSVMIQVEATRD